MNQHRHPVGKREGGGPQGFNKGQKYAAGDGSADRSETPMTEANIALNPSMRPIEKVTPP